MFFEWTDATNRQNFLSELLNYSFTRIIKSHDIQVINKPARLFLFQTLDLPKTISAIFCTSCSWNNISAKLKDHLTPEKKCQNSKQCVKGYKWMYMKVRIFELRRMIWRYDSLSLLCVQLKQLWNTLNVRMLQSMHELLIMLLTLTTLGSLTK